MVRDPPQTPHVGGFAPKLPFRGRFRYMIPRDPKTPTCGGVGGRETETPDLSVEGWLVGDLPCCAQLDG